MLSALFGLQKEKCDMRTELSHHNQLLPLRVSQSHSEADPCLISQLAQLVPNRCTLLHLSCSNFNEH